MQRFLIPRSSLSSDAMQTGLKAAYAVAKFASFCMLITIRVSRAICCSIICIQDMPYSNHYPFSPSFTYLYPFSPTHTPRCGPSSWVDNVRQIRVLRTLRSAPNLGLNQARLRVLSSLTLWGRVSAPGIFFDSCPTGDLLGGALIIRNFWYTSKSYKVQKLR